MRSGSRIRYVIDAQDKITAVGESWDEFADANDGSRLATADVLGRSLWDFIADAPTRQLYKQMVARVRNGQATQFSLRCDGPACRRLLQMNISAKPDGSVVFETLALSEEERKPLPLLALSTIRSDELLQMCAWCNRLDVGVGTNVWVEVEEATERLKLFERDKMPELSHGICEDCLKAMTQSLAEMDANAEPKAGA